MVYKQHEISSRALNNKERDLVEQISKTIPIIEQAIADVRYGEKEGVNEKQLIKIQKELVEMTNHLNPREYMPGFGHVIADSWDSDCELGDLLLGIVAKYKKL